MATPTTGIDIQPIVVDDHVIVSSVPVSIGGIYTPGDRGVVTALDTATGEVRWTFDTVKGDLWGHPEVNSGGGAWYSPAVDEERRLVYVGVANPAPFPGTADWPNSTSRPGPNLYTDSVVALDLRSGAIRTILWATGFRPDLSWLDVGVFDRKGNVRHDGGVTASPGLYLIGMPFLRRRKSTLIDGAAADAADLSRHLAHYLDCN